MQISNVFNMSERFVRQFDIKDGECGVRWHVGDIDCHRVKEAYLRVALHNRDYAGSFGKRLLHATGEEGKLNDDARRL